MTTEFDYSTTSGPASRWTNAYGGPFNYPDMTLNDEKAITYTSRPLEDDVEITGHLLLFLWVTSTADDGDFFAYLEEVLADGSSSYVTEGVLRASHRHISAPPWGLASLPYHRSFAEDVVGLPDGPVELVFDLHPISRVFKSGHRVRLSIACADRDNALALVAPSPPLVRIYRGIADVVSDLAGGRQLTVAPTSDPRGLPTTTSRGLLASGTTL